MSKTTITPHTHSTWLALLFGTLLVSGTLSASEYQDYWVSPAPLEQDTNDHYEVIYNLPQQESSASQETLIQQSTGKHQTTASDAPLSKSETATLNNEVITHNRLASPAPTPTEPLFWEIETVVQEEARYLPDDAVPADTTITEDTAIAIDRNQPSPEITVYN